MLDLRHQKPSSHRKSRYVPCPPLAEYPRVRHAVMKWLSIHKPRPVRYLSFTSKCPRAVTLPEMGHRFTSQASPSSRPHRRAIDSQAWHVCLPHYLNYLRAVTPSLTGHLFTGRGMFLFQHPENIPASSLALPRLLSSYNVSLHTLSHSSITDRRMFPSMTVKHFSRRKSRTNEFTKALTFSRPYGLLQFNALRTPVDVLVLSTSTTPGLNCWLSYES